MYNFNTTNNNTLCPIRLNSHEYAGDVYSIEKITNINFGDIRTVILNNEPYFSSKDVCKGLDISNHSDASQKAIKYSAEYYSLINKQYNPLNLYYYVETEIPQGKSVQKVRELFVSENVLYMLIFNSNKKDAMYFKAWVSDVIKDMRKFGATNPITSLQELSNYLGSIDNNINAGFAGINTNIYNGFNNVNDYMYKGFTGINSNMYNGFNNVKQYTYKGFTGVNDNINNGVNFLNNRNAEFQNFIISRIQELLIAEGVDINNTKEIKEKVDGIIRGLCTIYKANINNK
jgi:prophage antirepressor-like protein